MVDVQKNTARWVYTVDNQWQTQWYTYKKNTVRWEYTVNNQWQTYNKNTVHWAYTLNNQWQTYKKSTLLWAYTVNNQQQIYKKSTLCWAYTVNNDWQANTKVCYAGRIQLLLWTYNESMLMLVVYLLQTFSVLSGRQRPGDLQQTYATVSVYIK